MRWLVDGMNVIGSRPDGWWHNRRQAIATFVERLEQWAATHGDEVTVVFEHPLEVKSSSITVAHAPRAAANSADDEIVRLIQADQHPKDIRVATSDRALADRVRAEGASVYPAQQLRDLIEPR